MKKSRLSVSFPKAREFNGIVIDNVAMWAHGRGEVIVYTPPTDDRPHCLVSMPDLRGGK